MFGRILAIMAVILMTVAFSDDVNAQDVEGIEFSIRQEAKRNAEIEAQRIKELIPDGITSRSKSPRAVEDLQVLSTNVMGTSGYIPVYGEVRNNGTERMDYVYIYCVVLDASCNVTGARGTYVYSSGVHNIYTWSGNEVSSYTDTAGLNPGETGLFSVYPSLRGDFGSVQFFVSGNPTSASEYIPMGADIVPSGSLSYQKNDQGRLQISGTLKNSGYLTARNIRLTTFVRNTEGKIIDCDYGYGSMISELAPGGTQEISASTYISYDGVDLTTVSHKIYWDENAADAGDDKIVRNSVTLDGSRSYSFGGTASYNWTLSHSQNPDFSRTAEGMTPSVPDMSPGFYNVTLALTDSSGHKWTDSMLLVAAGGLSDITGDGKIGLPEAIYALQVVSGVVK